MVQPTIPRHDSDITASWLQHALSTHSSGRIVHVNVQVPPHHGSMSRVRRVAIQYDSDDSFMGSSGSYALPSVIVKYAKPESENPMIALLMRDGALYEHELRLYHKLREDNDPIAPRIFFQDFDPSTGDFVIVMEDLSLGGVSIEQRLKGNLSDAMDVIEHLARFQARWWHDPPHAKGFHYGAVDSGRSGPMSVSPYVQSGPRGSNDTFMREQGMEWMPLSFSFLYLTRMVGTQQHDFAIYNDSNFMRLVRNFESGFESLMFVVDALRKQLESGTGRERYAKVVRIVSSFATRREEIITRYAQALHDVTEKFPRTIVHGDFRSENMALMQNEWHQSCNDMCRSQVRIIDWQCCSVGCGLWDVSTFVVQCLDPQTRAEYETLLLSHYTKSLNEALAGRMFVEHEDVLRWYRSCMWFKMGFVAATIGPIWRAYVDRGMELERSGRLFDIGIEVMEKVCGAIHDGFYSQ